MDRYDRAITIFSPDGHLFQVEYAQEAVKKGSTAVGIRGRDCVVIAVEKKSVPQLQDDRTLRKICQLDDHIVMTFAGLNADARQLINMARVECQSYKLTMEDPVTVRYITEHVSKIKQRYTQSNGRRPFGISAIIAGFDPDGSPHLFTTEPSGTNFEYKANAIGRNAKTVKEYLEKHWSSDAVVSVDATLKLAVRALCEAVQTGAQNIEVACMTWKLTPDQEHGAPSYRLLTVSEIDDLLKLVEKEKEREAQQQQQQRTA